MSVKTSRSLSTIKAAGSGVAERARRYTAPKRSSDRPGERADGHRKKRSRSSPRAKASRTSRVVVRRVDALSVLKVSVLFYLSLSLALFTAGVLLWAGARSVGLIGNVEGFMDKVGFTDFRIQAGELLRASIIGSAVFVVAGSLANLLMAVLFNLISGVVGGVKLVLAEDQNAPKG
ncbi:MAG: DUF3566 domain-containing protein [Acidimicrobiales bacterium]